MFGAGLTSLRQRGTTRKVNKTQKWVRKAQKIGLVEASIIQLCLILYP